MKTVHLSLLTWPITQSRFDSFVECVARIRANIMASGHRIVLGASSESYNVPMDLRYDLASWCEIQKIPLEFRPSPNDLGANGNAALDMGSDCDFTTYCQDDHWFTEPIDISPLCNFLDASPEFSLVRFGWAHTTFLGPIEGWPLQEVNLDGNYPYADEPWLGRSDGKIRFIEGGQHGCQEGHLCAELVRAKARIAATMKPVAVHAGIPSTIEARRPKA